MLYRTAPSGLPTGGGKNLHVFITLEKQSTTNSILIHSSFSGERCCSSFFGAFLNFHSSERKHELSHFKLQISSLHVGTKCGWENDTDTVINTEKKAYFLFKVLNVLFWVHYRIKGHPNKKKKFMNVVSYTDKMYNPDSQKSIRSGILTKRSQTPSSQISTNQWDSWYQAIERNTCNLHSFSIVYVLILQEVLLWKASGLSLPHLTHSWCMSSHSVMCWKYICNFLKVATQTARLKS